MEEAKTVLAEGRKYAPQFNENPNLRETLKTLSGALDRSLRSESPEWELIKSERQRIEDGTTAEPGQKPGPWHVHVTASPFPEHGVLRNARGDADSHCVACENLSGPQAVIARSWCSK